MDKKKTVAVYMDDGSLRWYRDRTIKNGDKVTTIYCADGCPYTIQGRTRQIPHANGVGSWKYTSFYVMTAGGHDAVEKHTLKDAKEWAEAHTCAPSEYAAMRGGA